MILRGPQPLNDDSRMPFGKHRGERMEDVPEEYWEWLSNQEWFDWNSPVGQYIENNVE